MNRTLTFTPAAVVVALSLAALPAAAQNHRGGGEQRGGGRATASQSAPRQAPRMMSAPARSSMARAPENRSFAAPQRGSFGTQRAVPHTFSGRSYQAGPRAVPRTFNGPTYRGPVTRGQPFQGPSHGYIGGRGFVAPGNRGFAARPSLVRPYFSRNYARPHDWVPYRPYRFGRPYYVFSPWLSLGFGLWCGYPVPYPWGYIGDYEPMVFGDADEAYQVVGDVASYGGASFDIQPPNADLFVDGRYVGPVGDFGPNAAPLTLEPGPHRFAIQCDGYRPMEWDATIEPGEVIPYRGALELE